MVRATTSLLLLLGFIVALTMFLLGVLTVWGHSTVTPENVRHAPLLLPGKVGWALIGGGVAGMVVLARTLTETRRQTHAATVGH